MVRLTGTGIPRHRNRDTDSVLLGGLKYPILGICNFLCGSLRHNPGKEGLKTPGSGKCGPEEEWLSGRSKARKVLGVNADLKSPPLRVYSWEWAENLPPRSGCVFLSPNTLGSACRTEEFVVRKQVGGVGVGGSPLYDKA